MLKKNENKNMTFLHFLSSIPAKDYVYQKEPYQVQIEKAAKMIKDADYILIGAGAGFSSAAGLTYSGKRFTDHFFEFIEKYHMSDMYSAGFYPFKSEEERWGYWSKHVYVNRILPDALPLYKTLYDLVKEKEYFVLTTNADHQFYKAGFGENRIFATQGDYGRIQCLKGCHNQTYDDIKMIQQMNQARKDCCIPSYMVPKCPVCGGKMTMNLRCDQYFVEDDFWHEAESHFSHFLQECLDKNVVFLELGVGFNTPTIIRFPFEKQASKHQNIKLIRLNLDQAIVPDSLGKRAIGINEDLQKSIEDIKNEVFNLKNYEKRGVRDD